MAFCTSCFSFAAATASAGVAVENVAAYINNTALQLQKNDAIISIFSILYLCIIMAIFQANLG